MAPPPTTLDRAAPNPGRTPTAIVPAVATCADTPTAQMRAGAEQKENLVGIVRCEAEINQDKIPRLGPNEAHHLPLTEIATVLSHPLATIWALWNCYLPLSDSFRQPLICRWVFLCICIIIFRVSEREFFQLAQTVGRDVNEILDRWDGNALASEIRNNTEGRNWPMQDRSVELTEDVCGAAVTGDNNEWSKISAAHFPV
ncbi:hypothetical protein DFH09DRAFT_1103147 [Mycena vulgaris]|nr:hypothetical protein DFH09DRAFT_1104866 [Mycena vulgaris]KAJ6498615.1 hypothetical protein DFH09DRAFT_1103147 [Mycena vulgaris]